MNFFFTMECLVCEGDTADIEADTIEEAMQQARARMLDHECKQQPGRDDVLGWAKGDWS